MKRVEKIYGEKEVKKVLNKAGRPIVTAARRNIPRANRDLHRKDAAGNIVATYASGNLQRSIRRLLHLGRRHRNKENIGVWFGAKVSKKGQGGGLFKGNRTDGFYGAFFEEGVYDPSGYRRIRARRFWSRAVRQTEGTIRKRAVTGLKNMLRREAKRKKVD